MIAGVAKADSPWALARLAEALPEGHYRLDGAEVGANALGWLLGQYRFTRYRKGEDTGARVLLTRDVAHREEVIRLPPRPRRFAIWSIRVLAISARRNWKRRPKPSRAPIMRN